MLKLYLIRHGKTYGNTRGRYIGRTDEGLCEAGIRMLSGRRFPAVEMIYTSPLKRCQETADLIYPGQCRQILEDLAECDFGVFENKNYKELDGKPDYQKWVDSQGTLPFPEGESQEAFRGRCIGGFEQAVADCIEKGHEAAALVVHGGTIMAVLEKYACPHQDFYSWHVDNGRGYAVELDRQQWVNGRQQVTVLSKITMIDTQGED